MSFANKQGLKFDTIHKPIGGRIQEAPTPGKRYKRLDNSSYMSEASIATCTSCLRVNCNGRCEKILEVERQNVDPKKRTGGMRMVRPAECRYDYRGKKYTALELAEIGGISRATFYDRVKRGWTIEEAVETPLRCKGRPRRE